jgi:hypothetical protein
MPHGFLITPNNPEKVLVSVGISQRGVYVMSDGTNFILGQRNDAESQTKLIRVGDDTSASLFVQNEGDSLLAVIGIDWWRRYCIRCLGMGDVYHYLQH